MSLLAKQTIKSSIYSYLGVVIGYITTIHLLPEFLSTAEIGNIRLIQNYSRLFSNLLLFGIPLTTIRIFPKIDSLTDRHFGFLNIAVFGGLVASALFVLLFSLTKNILFIDDIEKSEIFGEYIYLILPFTIVLIFFNLFDAYATALKQSTIGVFLRDFVFRIGFIGFLLLLIFNILSYKGFMTGLWINEFIVLLLLVAFLVSQKQFFLSTKITIWKKVKKSEFIRLSSFNWLSSISQIAVIMIDTLMIGKMIGDSGVGVYSTYFYMASIMLIPSKSLLKISGPILSEAFNSNNIQRVKEVYQKSASNQFITGGFIFFNLLIGLPVILKLLGDDFSSGFWIIPFVGAGYMFRLGTGIKAKIIATSEYYSYNSYLTFLFIVLLVVTNYFGISYFGLSGAAFATMISSFIYNISGLIVLHLKLKIYPWSKNLKRSLIFLTSLSLPFTSLSFALDSVTYSFIISASFSLLFLIVLIKSRLSADIIALLTKIPILNKFV